MVFSSTFAGVMLILYMMIEIDAHGFSVNQLVNQKAKQKHRPDPVDGDWCSVDCYGSTCFVAHADSRKHKCADFKLHEFSEYCKVPEGRPTRKTCTCFTTAGLKNARGICRVDHGVEHPRKHTCRYRGVVKKEVPAGTHWSPNQCDSIKDCPYKE